MAAIVVIPKQTVAVTTPVPFRVQGHTNPGVMAEGLSGAEEIPILKSVDGGLTFEAVQQEGLPLVLTVTNNMYAIDAAAIYAVTKPVTSSAAGVFFTSDQQV